MISNTRHKRHSLLVACGLCVGLASSAASAQSTRLASVMAVRVVAAHNEQGGLRSILASAPSEPGSCGLSGTWFESVGSVGGDTVGTGARAVSPDGNVVVGWTMVRSSVPGGEPVSQPFVWTPCDGMQALLEELPGVSGGSAIGVSAGGQVVVGVGFGASPVGYRQYSRDEADVLIDFGTGLATSATSVSADGSVMVGSASDALGRQAFIHASGSDGVTALGDLLGGAGWSDAYAVSSNGSAVAGQSLSLLGPEAFLWTVDSGMIGLGDLPGGDFDSIASAISTSGLVVVGTGRASHGSEAFRWSVQSGMVGLGDLPGGSDSSEALAVSGNGAIVVGRSQTADGSEAFIWDATHGMRRIEDVLAASVGYDFPDWTLTAAHGISADGSVIVGTGVNPSGLVQGWVAHIPVTHCLADFNHDGVSNSLDYFAFLQAFFTGNADFDNDGQTTSQDFFVFFTSFFTGCA